MRLRPYGDTGLLVEADDLDTVLGLHAALDAAPLPGVVDLVPAISTLLIRLDPARTTVAEVAAGVRAVEPRRPADREAGRVEVPVHYDGEDLDAVGEVTGLGRQGVIAAHTGQVWTVAFAGFAPGFGYLSGEDERLRVPRRDEPRTRVPAGAVGLADRFGGIYPRPSPGGWQLIGHTDLAIWDLSRDPPALLRPGVQVRFVAAR